MQDPTLINEWKELEQTLYSIQSSSDKEQDPSFIPSLPSLSKEEEKEEEYIEKKTCCNNNGGGWQGFGSWTIIIPFLFFMILLFGLKPGIVLDTKKSYLQKRKVVCFSKLILFSLVLSIPFIILWWVSCKE
jgi:hypothetical protein